MTSLFELLASRFALPQRVNGISLERTRINRPPRSRITVTMREWPSAVQAAERMSCERETWPSYSRWHVYPGLCSSQFLLANMRDNERLKCSAWSEHHERYQKRKRPNTTNRRTYLILWLGSWISQTLIPLRSKHTYDRLISGNKLSAGMARTLRKLRGH